jgi:hypothetical protein
MLGCPKLIAFGTWALVNNRDSGALSRPQLFSPRRLLVSICRVRNDCGTSKQLVSRGGLPRVRQGRLSHQAGLFLKEISVIVRTTWLLCLATRQATCERGLSQVSLCSGASVSDSAEESLAHHRAACACRLCILLGMSLDSACSLGGPNV